MMAYYKGKSNLDESILEIIQFISNKRHNKLTKDLILRMLCVNGDDIHEGLLEVLLDELVECNIIKEQGKYSANPYHIIVELAEDNSVFQSYTET